ncbi:hypothetical protein [Anoxynatronum buryatiense]|uniref:Uncharacterized protein n=2 Tax=Anoxynatronum buryatiense TaxID=489973 RepID=A0AA45WU13_9CLOT|nr:hypothetical protein [Anoxynatronum buryatiense]SMP41261.1 hypothetical protein SAMN06296020_101478 [Anoxynatronum buryatiense]
MNISNVSSTNYYTGVKAASNNNLQDKFEDLINSETDIYVSEKFKVAKNNDFGSKVFDLSKLNGRLQNTLLSNDVKMFYQESTGRTIFRTFFKKPDSNEPMIVDVCVPNHKFSEGIDEKTFNETIGKAILLMDRVLSMHAALGEVVADAYGSEFRYIHQAKELDFSGYVEGIKNRIKSRANYDLYKDNPLSSGKHVSEATIQELLKELEDILFELKIKM